jgi:hypothetical protein
MVEDLATTLRGEAGKGDFGDLGAKVRGTEERVTEGNSHSPRASASIYKQTPPES